VRLQSPAGGDGQHRRPAGGDRPWQIDRLDQRRRVRRQHRRRTGPGPQPRDGHAARAAGRRRRRGAARTGRGGAHGARRGAGGGRRVGRPQRHHPPRTERAAGLAGGRLPRAHRRRGGIPGGAAVSAVMSMATGLAAAANAERVKLLTTRAPLWSALGVAVSALGVAALQGLTAHHYSALPPQQAALGVVVFGIPVLMILAALTVTGEHRTGAIRTTFLAVPRRTVAIAAKTVVATVFCGGWAALMTVAAILAAGASADPMAAAHLTPTGAAGWRVIAGVTAFA